MTTSTNNRAVDREPIGFGWLLVLAIALVGRALVLLSGAVSFHSDEAVVALMARHINLGYPIPTFFYGQHYMGSLDALIVAVFFRIFGENVMAIRLAQSALYLLLVVTTMLLAKQLTGRRNVAILAGVLIAVPPVVLTLYTSMTLGGYGETLVLGNLVLLIAWRLPKRASQQDRGALLQWGALGVIGGLGWWTNALIAVYLLSAALWLLLRLRWRVIPGAVLAGIMFIVGGAPWWIYNLQHDWLAVRWLLDTSQNNNGLTFTLGERTLGFFFVGLPSVLGLRFPWEQAVWNGFAAGIMLVLFLIVIFREVIYGLRRKNSPERFLLFVIGCFVLIFIGSAFGADVTGRYLLPLCIPLAICLALWLTELFSAKQGYRWAAVMILIFVIGLQVAGNLTAIRAPVGLTSQFDLVNHIPNDHDQELIEFLKAHNATRGFGTYWMTFRLAFLSREEVILDAWLPNKLSFLYNPGDRRYAPYTQAVLAAERPVYVTANVPELEQRVEAGLKRLQISYQRQQIGSYVVFYDLSRRVLPSELEIIPKSAEPSSAN
jgi:4-amino-4-deoxy-L-arabinose transferase-like glycosyltransferase